MNDDILESLEALRKVLARKTEKDLDEMYTRIAGKGDKTGLSVQEYFGTFEDHFILESGSNSQDDLDCLVMVTAEASDMDQLDPAILYSQERMKQQFKLVPAMLNSSFKVKSESMHSEEHTTNTLAA
jgi:hypothetical protein